MRYKYPRTPHLPFSPGFNPDDIRSGSVENFEDQEVVVTTKMDGEGTTLYSDGFHARSLDSRHHVSRCWIKGLHANICHNIPAEWRVCGENLFAKHSIYYTELPSYFLLFSIWNDQNVCLSWDETKEWATLLGLITVPELYRGTWDDKIIRACYTGQSFGGEQEGYVVRMANQFHYDDFHLNVGKWVRPKHIKTDQNWMYQPVVPNQLKEKEKER